MFGLFKNRESKKNLTLGKESRNKKPIVISENIRFRHEAIVGWAGTGKSAVHQLRRITHDLLLFASGEKRSIFIIEEKGTLLEGAKQQMKRLGISSDQVTIINACDEMYESGWNPLLEERGADIFSKALLSCLNKSDYTLNCFIEDNCRWMAKLAKAYFKDRVNLKLLFHLYVDPRYLADVVEELKDTNKTNENPELLSIIDHFTQTVLSYREHEEEGVMVPTRYPEGHPYEGLQVVTSTQSSMNLEVIELLEDLLRNKQLSKILNTTSSFRVLDAIREPKIVFIRTPFIDNRGFLGNLFINAFGLGMYANTQHDHPCFLTIDDAGVYDLHPIKWMFAMGERLKLGISLSFQTIDSSLYPLLQQILTITVMQTGWEETSYLLDVRGERVQDIFAERERLQPSDIMALPRNSFCIFTYDMKSGKIQTRIGHAPYALECPILNKAIASHERRKMLL